MKKLNLFCFGFGQVAKNFVKRIIKEKIDINLITTTRDEKKTKIFEEALRLKIPIEKTWSCYQGESKPCGRCDSCRIRDKALKEIGREDLCSQNI